MQTSLPDTMMILIIKAGIVFGGILPYIPQYIDIFRRRNSAGFSTLCCFILLMASILRCGFWFGLRFETPLLLQAVFMIIAQLLMLELCVRFRKCSSIIGNSSSRHNERKSTLFNPWMFWRWNIFSDYVIFISFISLMLAITCYAFYGVDMFYQSLGGLALAIEACLAMPQLMKNYKANSTAGMSVWMVLGWFIGDAFKTIYFYFSAAPWQFLFCGLTQLTVDVLLLFQIKVYSSSSSSSTVIDTTTS